VRNAMLGYRQKDIAGILENIVYIELLRRGYRVTTGRYDALEVDFVARRNDETLYVQVAYLLASEATEKREFRALEQIDDNFPKLVLSMDKVWGKGRNGIRRLYLPDFLLERQ